MPATTIGNRSRRSTGPQGPVTIGPNEIGKLPPQSLELEQAVLGAIMIQKDAFGTVSEILTPNSFYDNHHFYIYQAIQSIAAADEPIDALTVVEQLKRMNTLEQAGGAAYISDLTLRVASAAHLYRHAQILAQKALARDLIRFAADVEDKAYSEEMDVNELLQSAEGSLFEISKQTQKKDVTQIDPVIDEALKVMREASKNKDSVTGVRTGFTDLDAVTSGWQKSDLIIIAARPAMGKTAFVLSMAKQIAVDFRQPVAMFSLEMSNRQLVNRLMMNVCEIEGSKIRNGSLSQSDWDRLHHKVNALLGAPIYVDDTPGLSVFELRSKARRLKQQYNISCLIIDYLQLMTAAGMNPGSREQEVSMISRSLKGLAKELDIPIIALSQLNRSVEQRGTGVEGKEPQLSDLRESGAIEQDADMVIFIHRPEYYFRSGSKSESYDQSLVGQAQIIIAKHRNGATKTVNLRFRGEYAKFENNSNTEVLPGVQDAVTAPQQTVATPDFVSDSEPAYGQPRQWNLSGLGQQQDSMSVDDGSNGTPF
ncbi:MAG: replicative DNA helicase [Paludibacteraceae bacterium]|nr:replicative DNA helicase [Paludibacteraceae bacterium]